MDQRVEPPSWLPDGAASTDPKDPASRDTAADDTGTDGVDSQGPVSYGSASNETASHDPVSQEAASDEPAGFDPAGADFSAEGSSAASSVSDPSGQDAAADLGAYSYAAETPHPNGRDAAFGPESASVSAYGQESGLAGAAAASGPSAYPTQFGTPAAEKTGEASRRTTVFPSMPRPKAKSASAKSASTAKATVTRGRRADLVLARLEPWSVMKFSFLISLVAWVMLFVAVAVLYFALSSLGVFDSIQKTLESVTSSSGSPGVSLTKWFSASRILGYTMLIGAINIVLITALSTVGAMIYNLVTHLGGGIEVTLRETD